MPSCGVRALQEKIDAWPLDMTVKNQPQRPVFRLPTARDDVEGSVFQPLPRPRQPQLGRIELEVGEVDDSIIPALEAGCQRRKATAEIAKETVVEFGAPRP